ncbi:hypothetical protein BVX98_00480, partial [bacterium F11]
MTLKTYSYLDISSSSSLLKEGWRKIHVGTLVLLGMLLMGSWSHADVILHVIDIGFGQAVHLEVEDNHYLFDTGRKETTSDILSHLADESVTRLTGIFLSHTHADHAGALLPLISQIKTDTVYWNEELPPNEDLVQDLDKAQSYTEFHLLEPDTRLKLGKKFQLRVLKNSLSFSDLNNNSLVFGLTYKGHRLLLASDAGIKRQQYLLKVDSKWLKKVDWLLWPHHGDELDSSFLETLAIIDFCVVSVGENEYGLPNTKLEDQSQLLCKKFFRTDKNGPLSFFIKRKIRLRQSKFDLRCLPLPMNTKKIKYWLIAIGYVGFIYATLSNVRIPISFLRAKGLLNPFLYILFGISISGLIGYLIHQKNRDWWRYVLLGTTFVLYLFLSRHTPYPEEQIHLLEYGLVGVLFLRALSLHWGFGAKSYIVALIISSLAGWLDEIIQG